MLALVSNQGSEIRTLTNEIGKHKKKIGKLEKRIGELETKNADLRTEFNERLGRVEKANAGLTRALHVTLQKFGQKFHDIKVAAQPTETPPCVERMRVIATKAEVAEEALDVLQAFVSSQVSSADETTRDSTAVAASGAGVGPLNPDAGASHADPPSSPAMYDASGASDASDTHVDIPDQ